MKKLFLWMLSICLISCFTACGRQEEPVDELALSQPDLEESTQPESTSEEEVQGVPGNQSISEESQEHILIAYFTWADNTVVEDENLAIQSALAHYESVGDTSDYSGTDAISSASVVAPGNTAKMAEWIQQYVGGDLFPIIVTEPYPSNYDDEYEIILLGYPNWWASIPMPIASFLEEYDFSGKTIIPFCSHGGGRFGQSLTAITKLAPDSIMGEALAVSYSGGSTLPDDITEWLKTNRIIE